MPSKRRVTVPKGKEMVTLISGKAIKRYRLSRGLSQEDFAHEFGVSQVTVSRWESGRQRPDIASAQRLKALLYGADDFGDNSPASKFVESFSGVATIVDEDYSVITSSSAVSGLSEEQAEHLFGLGKLQESTRQFVAEAHNGNEVLLGLLQAGASDMSLKLERLYIPIVINGRQCMLIVALPTVPGLE